DYYCSSYAGSNTHWLF
nr:immunoglobulin light chain junction region [Macaca mulatta]MOV66586.1 immunoglobulin light chain junction region [Macaca mulatta]MOV67553.1 immunoglobulin light chain junction region [Macaca mulatta]MOV69458.1 immunoglobulin light chain junction region [Macaca mulatta]MOV70260.1 immunoglobulin light chain junction region [Macaca mulatta]